ncbi:unnamed protein product [Caenorhabditis sp. 36 PRJEB53466]|nr:unnamed protein product [Caenorhabditis sp. 36 PRJEB53466]
MMSSRSNTITNNSSSDISSLGDDIFGAPLPAPTPTRNACQLPVAMFNSVCFTFTFIFNKLTKPWVATELE